MKHLRLRLLTPIGMGLMTACGGSGTPATTPTVIPSFSAAGGGSPVTLAAVSLDSAKRSTSAQTGTLNPNDNSYSLGTLSGTINSDRTAVSLTGGGQIVMRTGTTEFARLFTSTPTGGNRTIGIVGAATPASDLPTGTASYSGTSSLTLRDGASIYELAGNATIAADFAAGNVTTTANALSGTRTTGLTAPTKVTDVATVAFTGSTISGATFAGGTPSITSSTLTKLGSGPTNSLKGAFFGTGADEAGATFVIDDASDSGIIVFGTVIAD